MQGELVRMWDKMFENGTLWHSMNEETISSVQCSVLAWCVGIYKLGRLYLLCLRGRCNDIDILSHVVVAILCNILHWKSLQDAELVFLRNYIMREYGA